MSFPNNPANGDTFTRFGKLFRFRAGTSSWEPVSSPIIATAVESTAKTTSVQAADNLPLVGNELGSVAFVQETNRLYIWNGSGWFQVGLINTSPTITSGANATYDLAKDGTPTIITLDAEDPEGVPLTWSYQVTSGSLGGTTVTNNGNVFTITPSTNEADAGSFSLSFTASDGVNIASVSTTLTLQFAAPPGQSEFTTAGTYSWTAPAGVTSVSVVCVGGGGGGRSAGVTSTERCGGGGGGLGWKNNIPVVPGQSYIVVVGDAGTRATINTAVATTGGSSYFINDTVVAGFGGGGGLVSGDTPGGGFVGDGGGAGGSGRRTASTSGGGGAGGYSGNGGAGAVATNRSDDESGSGNGGTNANGGGGVGIFGKGATGTIPGQGGSGGSSGGSVGGGSYGGGGSSSGNTISGFAGTGAVRIIWGDNRAFPSTNTQDM